MRAQRGERRAADQHQVRGAPERHVLAEQAVPDVVEREAGQRERAAGGDHRAADGRPPAVAQVHGGPARALGRPARSSSTPASEHAVEARRGSGSGPGWPAAPGRARCRCAARCPSTCRAPRRAASRSAGPTAAAAQPGSPVWRSAQRREPAEPRRCGRCGGPRSGRRSAPWPRARPRWRRSASPSAAPPAGSSPVACERRSGRQRVTPRTALSTAQSRSRHVAKLPRVGLPASANLTEQSVS